MKKQLCIGLLALFCTVVASGIASAADITWKNQVASNATCSLKASVVGPLGAVPQTTSYTFTALGQTTKTTVSSIYCIRIDLLASCSYTDAQGKKKVVSFNSSTPASCGNNTATLNPSIPGSITVTPSQSAPPNTGFTYNMHINNMHIMPQG